MEDQDNPASRGDVVYMCRVITVLLLQIAVLVAVLPQPAKASDGDVDYSSPYITVDPKTGQLVTRNPGPRLKTHSMDMGSEKTSDSVAALTAESATTPPPADMPEQAAQSDSGFNPATIAIIAGALFVAGVVIARMKKQKT